MRISAVLLLALLLSSCGGTQSISQFGDVPLVLGSEPGADEAGIFLATQRGYDTGEGVTLLVERSGAADFRVLSKPPAGCVTVLAIVRPDKLVLCVDEVILQDERPKVVAVARALARGYIQAQREPESAVNAMIEQNPELDRVRLSTQLDTAAATWTAGAEYFGALTRGPGRDPSVAREASTGS